MDFGPESRRGLRPFPVTESKNVLLPLFLYTLDLFAEVPGSGRERDVCVGDICKPDLPEAVCEPANEVYSAARVQVPRDSPCGPEEPRVGLQPVVEVMDTWSRRCRRARETLNPVP